jgi:hypothetical protein
VRSKFRKITINDRQYLITKSEDYSYGRTLDINIYLKGHQRTPLMIRFQIINKSPIIFQSLGPGITIYNSKTNESVQVNFNEPKYIRELILLGIKNGWTGTNYLPRQDGLLYLTEMGFEVSHLNYLPIQLAQKIALKTWWQKQLFHK